MSSKKETLSQRTNLSLLKRQAKIAAWFKGHTLRRFRVADYGVRLVAVSSCKICEAFIFINTNPRSNQIEIGGVAVAVACKQVSSLSAAGLKIL